MSWNRGALAKHDRPLFLANDKINSHTNCSTSSKYLDVALATRDQQSLFTYVDKKTDGSIWPVCQSNYIDNAEALNAESMSTSIRQQVYNKNQLNAQILSHNTNERSSTATGTGVLEILEEKPEEQKKEIQFNDINDILPLSKPLPPSSVSVSDAASNETNLVPELTALDNSTTTNSLLSTSSLVSSMDSIQAFRNIFNNYVKRSQTQSRTGDREEIPLQRSNSNTNSIISSMSNSRRGSMTSFSSRISHLYINSQNQSSSNNQKSSSSISDKYFHPPPDWFRPAMAQGPYKHKIQPLQYISQGTEPMFSIQEKKNSIELTEIQSEIGKPEEQDDTSSVILQEDRDVDVDFQDAMTESYFSRLNPLDILEPEILGPEACLLNVDFVERFFRLIGCDDLEPGSNVCMNRRFSKFGRVTFDKTTQTLPYPAALLSTDMMSGPISSAPALNMADSNLTQPPISPSINRLGIGIILESKTEQIQCNQLRFICGQNMRRDEYLHHFKNIHCDIHSHLNGWFEQRCPYSIYGCNWTQVRLLPNYGHDEVIHDNKAGVFCCKNTISKKSKMTNIEDLPNFILQRILVNLDSYSLNQLVKVNKRFRNLIREKVLKYKGMVVREWVKVKAIQNTNSSGNENALSVKGMVWRRCKPKWSFSNCSGKMDNWRISDSSLKVANHLKNECEFSRQAAQCFVDYHGESVPLCGMVGLSNSDNDDYDDFEDTEDEFDQERLDEMLASNFDF